MTDPRDQYFEPVVDGAVRTLCCEGLCSKTYALDDITIGRLKAAGYSPIEMRTYITSRLAATNHVEVRRLVNERTHTVVVFSKCLACGHERQSGLEEL